MKYESFELKEVSSFRLIIHNNISLRLPSLCGSSCFLAGISEAIYIQRIQADRNPHKSRQELRGCCVLGALTKGAGLEGTDPEFSG